MWSFRTVAICCSAVACSLQGQKIGPPPIDLPSSKQILPSVPGTPQRLNSLPMAFALSPDGRYTAIVNAGFGTAESNYKQSIAILENETGKLFDFPEERTGQRAPQTLYNGLVWSADGRHLYAALDSISKPTGDSEGATGNAIAVYRFDAGKLLPERLLPVPLQPLTAGRTQNQLDKSTPPGAAIPLPTGLALVHRSAQEDDLLIADEFSDDVLLMNTTTGEVLRRFDLGAGSVTPSTYPIAVTATRDGRRAFVALWNGSAVAELDLHSGKVKRPLPLLPPSVKTGPSSHPTALLLSPDESRLYVALANRDTVAAVDVGHGAMRLSGLLDTRLPGQQYFGAIPSALALSEDGRTLFVANSGSDAVAVFNTAQAVPPSKAPRHATGFLPTEWFPTAVQVHGNRLLVATGKGKGTGPNAQKQPAPAHSDASTQRMEKRAHQYIGTLLCGSLATIDVQRAMAELPTLSEAVVKSNRMQFAQQHLAFTGSTNPIKHVIYIIKENRTYDQVLGDLPAGDGDPSLTMYGAAVTPNQHKLALQFGILDNFYDSGEVSGDGHVWSTAGITSDYTEKNWQQAYRGAERMYDYEGVVEEGYPLLEHISDVNEPQSGYLWSNLQRHGKSLYHFGEYVSSKFCDDSGEAPKDKSPLLGTPEVTREKCASSAILPGEQVPATYGGGRSPYPWHIPLLYRNVATKPELEGNFDPQYPDFNLKFPDQLRFEEFQTHLRAWESDRAKGNDTMPSFVMLRLANDHTAGTTPGSPTPKASIADNDLAVGRAVEAISHSAYWEDTAFFILEDDAQDGADHVDAHRSISLVISKYAPKPPQPLVDHTFYTTVSVLRTIEDLLGVPPMNNNDAFAPLIAPLFTGNGNQPAFAADYSNRDNGLIYSANTSQSPGAKQSAKMDFSHEDRAPARALNIILWKDAKGSTPVPDTILRLKNKQTDDDD